MRAVVNRLGLGVVCEEISATALTVACAEICALDQAELAKKLDKIAPLQKSVSAMEKEILHQVDDVIAPSVGLTLTGDDHDLVLGPKGKRTEVVDVAKAADLLGFELFIELASISITDLKKYLTPAALNSLISRSASKSRAKKPSTSPVTRFFMNTSVTALPS